MDSYTITKEEAKNIAKEFLKIYNRPPIIWDNKIRDLQLTYWDKHGFNITKSEVIKNKKELIESLEIESTTIMRYNPNIQSQKMILRELENLEEKDLQ